MSTQEFWWPVNEPFDEELNFNTLVTPFEDGKEQRRQKWSQPKRLYTISLRGKNKTDEDALWSFYQARAGAFDTFYFENPNESPAQGVASTTFVDGTTRTFVFPNAPWTSGDVTVYKNSVASGGGTYDRLNGTVTFPVGGAPEYGATITADYHFARVVRFNDDKLSRELFSYRLWNSEIKLIQVL